jgi:acylphosphatase
MHYLRLLIEGRVQGVGYRHFIVVEAGRLGVSGVVRNLPHGDVEVIAEGNREPLLRLSEQARMGPPRARVTNLVEQWAEGPPRYSGFGVGR